MFTSLFARKRDDATAWSLYGAAVTQARRREFYSTLGVPDTLDGRFELVALHVFLILHRLKRDRAETEELAQQVFDAMFADMDRSLREMGAGDVGVGPKVKRMAQAFYGRISAYDAALAGEPGALEDALRRNLYGTVAQPAEACLRAMRDYVSREAAHLARQDVAELGRGKVAFGTPPQPETGEA